MKKTNFYQLLLLCTITLTACGSIKYSQTSVPEEGSVNFVRLTQNSDNVIGNKVLNSKKNMMWWSNSKITLSPDGLQLGYLSEKNNTSNIMLRNAQKAGSSVQRTFRNYVSDLAWSPNGENIVFSELKNGRSSISIIKAKGGSILQQISNSSSDDFNPIFSSDGELIFFNKNDSYGSSIWSYNIANNLFTQYSVGYSPFPVKEEKSTFLCTRNSSKGRGEIWMVNYETGIETLILSDNEKSFSTPQLSPDGKWILCMGNSLANNKMLYRDNLDLFVVKKDGTNLTQLTYHPGNDVSPIWSKDGKSIYFISQRGTEKGVYNVWMMSF